MMPREFRGVAMALALIGLLSAGGAVTSSAQTPIPIPTTISAQTPVRTATPPTATSPQTPVRTPTLTPSVGGAQTATPTALSQQEPFLLTATLLGIAEVPGPGALTSIGSAAVLVDQGRAMVCYVLHVVNINPPTAAHIHEGAVDVAGPVVVPFNPPTGENSNGCVSNVDSAVASRIVNNPWDFYVNVHTSDFPDGAARGQLGR
jgi:hypothetical protein